MGYAVYLFQGECECECLLGWDGMGSGPLDLVTFPFPFIFTLESWRVGERQCIAREGGDRVLFFGQRLSQCSLAR